MTINRWATVHQWQKLVKQGIAKPLTAPDGTEYIVRINEDDEPVFWCASTESYFAPGLWWWENMRDTIDRAEIDTLELQVLQ